MELGKDNQDWVAKTTYFRLINNVVYRQDDKKNWVMSRVNEKGEIKDLDMNNEADKALETKYRPNRD
jgi:hypothetical protein